MPLERTNTLPHSLSISLPLAQQLAHAKSYHHLTSSYGASPYALLAPQQSPRAGVKEDPFSLSGFFPSSLAGAEEDEWSWLYSEDGHQATTTESHAMEGIYADLVKDISALEVAGQGEEELMKQTIKKEDKLGILSFDGVLGDRDDNYNQRADRLLSPYMEDNDPVDHEALYLNLCARRKSHLQTPSAGVATRFDGLFFPESKKQGVEDSGSLLETVLGRYID